MILVYHPHSWPVSLFYGATRYKSQGSIILSLFGLDYNQLIKTLLTITYKKQSLSEAKRFNTTTKIISELPALIPASLLSPIDLKFKQPSAGFYRNKEGRSGLYLVFFCLLLINLQIVQSHPFISAAKCRNQKSHLHYQESVTITFQGEKSRSQISNFVLAS